MREDLIERLRKCAASHGWTTAPPPDSVAALYLEAAAALEAAREDTVCAERYRWLRCGGWEVMQDPKYWRPELRFDGAIDAGRVAVALDAAIDQARGKGVADA